MEFEVRFFNDQVLLLDQMFGHRLTGIEGKDGNPLDEVRALCNSIPLNQGKLQVDKLPGWPNSAGASIKLPPENSVMKLSSSRRLRRNICKLSARAGFRPLRTAAASWFAAKRDHRLRHCSLLAARAGFRFRRGLPVHSAGRNRGPAPGPRRPQARLLAASVHLRAVRRRGYSAALRARDLR